ncbi:SDR family oxidoreductase [Sandaracinus amylolyticus]|uniref:Putative oxidoreductase/Short-chain dehydrogenase n=1 Tax=Sandaracinus amylolyticus TaxID=927083 RepID=A0A0F6YI04_9BACT|nr:SDR family oxidoreductase [Sandaracinus amylolyticus]AKF05385.1 putative oxidoreductase/Short-chain dehydrogenase [Sandaracinus amylolyticus]
MAHWTTADMPRQHGRSAVITGTGGLGLEDALELARAGGEVIIAGRNPQKGADAVAKIRAQVPAANVRFEVLDLASLASVADFAARLRSQRDSLDLLVNNAAVMVPPTRQETSDGLELQFGTNYLGHFALTAHLLPLLRKGQQPRVITLSSVASRDGKLAFDDLQETTRYVPMRAYSQSKLACLMFALELQRRSDAGRWGITSIAAHPGISRTDLLHNAPGRWSLVGVVRSLLWFLFQPASQGALPTLFAATSPDAAPGAYYGPHKLREMRGYPAPAAIPPQAQDRAAAERLWRVSEQLSGITFADVARLGPTLTV